MTETSSGHAAVALRQQADRIDALEAALRKVDQILSIPAAEYVPAIPDAWGVIAAALKATP
jgi:hypothetical protein